MTAFDS